MGVNYVIRPPESRLFRQCRRAWDLSARERQNYEPVGPMLMFDFGEAVHDALDVYYYPGMWEWDRAIVRPLAVAAFEKSMQRQRASYAQTGDMMQEQIGDWERHLELGAGLLSRYFEWAQEIDRFTPIQVAAQFDVTVPDPGKPGSGLVTQDGRGIRCRVKIDLAVIDDHELYWLVEHHIAGDHGWADLDRLRLDDQALTRSWAWQLNFLATVEGTIHNELRPSAADLSHSPGVELRAAPAAGGIITQQSTASFRRTHIPRTALEIDQRGVAIAQETTEMTDPSLPIYPNPSWGHCSACAYRPPCVALNQGLDEQPILHTSYRRRADGDFVPGRLGSLSGFVPEIHRVAEHRPPDPRR